MLKLCISRNHGHFANLHIQDGDKVSFYNSSIDIEEIYLKTICDKFSVVEYDSTHQAKDNEP